MTKPVACAVVFHSVSNARVLSIWIVTTPEAILSRVCAQLAVAAGVSEHDRGRRDRGGGAQNARGAQQEQRQQESFTGHAGPMK